MKMRGGTYRTSCGPFALAMYLGERKSPSSVSDLLESSTRVEPLSDARTKLAGVFTMLLWIFGNHSPTACDPGWKGMSIWRG